MRAGEELVKKLVEGRERLESRGNLAKKVPFVSMVYQATDICVANALAKGFASMGKLAQGAGTAVEGASVNTNGNDPNASCVGEGAFVNMGPSGESA